MPNPSKTGDDKFLRYSATHAFFQHLMHVYFVEMARDAIVRFVCLHSSMPSFSLWEASVKFWPNRYLEQQQQVQHQTDALSSIGPNPHQIMISQV